MSRKSIPLNALPGAGQNAPQGNSFINKEQMQIVDGAKQAMESFQHPVASNMIPAQALPQQAPQHHMPMQQQQQEPIYPPVEPIDPGLYYDVPDLAAMHQDIHNNTMEPHYTASTVNVYGGSVTEMIWNNETKTMAAVAVVFIAVSLLPMRVLLSKYVDINRIPHGELLTQAIIAALLVFAIRRLVLV
jgi:hypothetical protein